MSSVLALPSLNSKLTEAFMTLTASAIEFPLTFSVPSYSKNKFVITSSSVSGKSTLIAKLPSSLVISENEPCPVLKCGFTFYR